MVNTVKKKPNGTVETVKIRIGRDQNAKDRWSKCSTRLGKGHTLNMRLIFSGVVSTSSRPINPHLRKTKSQLPKWIQKVGPSREHILHGTTQHWHNLRLTKTNCLIISWELYPTLWMQWSGVFNTLLPVAPIGSRAGFALGTWNARSFFCRDPVAFGRKLQLFEKQITTCPTCA